MMEIHAYNIKTHTERIINDRVIDAMPFVNFWNKESDDTYYWGVRIFQA